MYRRLNKCLKELGVQIVSKLVSLHIAWFWLYAVVVGGLESSCPASLNPEKVFG